MPRLWLNVSQVPDSNLRGNKPTGTWLMFLTVINRCLTCVPARPVSVILTSFPMVVIVLCKRWINSMYSMRMIDLYSTTYNFTYVYCALMKK